MLPSLDRLALVPTGGNLGNARWPEDEVCSICTFPLARPSEDERYAWPFSGDGTGFTTVACVQGHAFHKGCLRFMQRFNDTNCPDCRKPMFKEVLKDVTRPDQEQIERERRQAEQRARAREERAREARERESERRRNAAAALRAPQMNEYAQPPEMSDFAVQWSFFVKGHVPLPPNPIWSEVRALFASYMREVMAAHGNPIQNWGQRLAVQVLHGNTAPRDMPAQTELLTFTRCRFRLHLPEAAARLFAEWLAMTIDRWGYTAAMDRVLGVKPAVQAGQAIAVMSGVFEEDSEATISIMNSQENASLGMTYQQYLEWLPFQHTVDPEAEPVEAPPGGPSSSASDPIADFRPLGGADTDVTIRWRFWLKGPMSAFDLEHTPTHFRRAFADRMRDAEGLPELRTSADPWFDRLWVWIRAEEPRITGPRSGSALVNGLVQRCEFALKLPANVASAWMTILAQAFGSTSWENLAQTWFYVEPVRSNGAGVDLPKRDSSQLYPLVGSPVMTEEAFNAWEPWRNIQRFFSIGETR